MAEELSRYVQKFGYTPEQADGLLRGGVPRYVGDRLGLYMDWCSMHEREPRYPESVLAYTHEALCNVAVEIGHEVRLATTADDAAEAFRPYREAFCDEQEKARGAATPPDERGALATLADLGTTKIGDANG